MKQEITIDQIHQIYELQKQILNGEISRTEATRIASMNNNSASYYLGSLKNLFEGKPYKGVISKAAAEFFLESIRSEYPQETFQRALESAYGFIHYYENETKTKVVELREVLRRFELVVPITDAEDKSSLSKEKRELESFEEGESQVVPTNRYERSYRARLICLESKGYACRVCNVELQSVYGNLAFKYIHVHHVVPISMRGGAYKVDPIKDLEPVCPNCHAMLHKKIPAHTIDELKLIIIRNQK